MSRKSEEEEVQVQQTMLTLPQRNMIEDVTSVCSKRKMERKKKREGDPTYGSEPCSVFVLSKIMFSICCEILKSDGSFF